MSPTKKQRKTRCRPVRFFFNLGRKLLRAWQFVSQEHIPRLALLMVCLMAVVGMIVLIVEQPKGQITSFGDAIYWAMITMSTVGYGDLTPQTPLGKVVTGLLVFSGMGLISLFTATIASVLTARKIRQSVGLEQVDATGHIVICGWNNNGEKIIDGLCQGGVGGGAVVVLVNIQPEDMIDELLFRYRDRDLELKYVQGDFVQESVLLRANIEQAYAAVVLAEGETPDDRTIRGALAIKSIKPEVKVCAEVMDPESEQHLRRLDVDDIIISGEYSGFLLASAATAPGITQAVRELLTYDSGNEIWRSRIPAEYVGRTFGELTTYFRMHHRAILIGVVMEEAGLPVEDIVGDDASPIDAFIKRKFREAGRDIMGETRKKARILINPEDSYEIGEDDRALIITSEPIQF